MSVGSLDPSKMPCHQAGHGAQKGQGQGTQRCRHDAEGRRGFVLRFKETCFLKGGHWSSSLSLWDILAKVGEKTPIQFMFICLWIGGRTAKSKRPSTRVSWMSDGSISALRMSLLPLFCTGQLVSRMSFWWSRNVHSETLRPRLKTGMWSSGSRSKTEHVPMFRNSGTESLNWKVWRETPRFSGKTFGDKLKNLFDHKSKPRPTAQEGQGHWKSGCPLGREPEAAACLGADAGYIRTPWKLWIPMIKSWSE